MRESPYCSARLMAISATPDAHDERPLRAQRARALSRGAHAARRAGSASAASRTPAQITIDLRRVASSCRAGARARCRARRGIPRATPSHSARAVGQGSAQLRAATASPPRPRRRAPSPRAPRASSRSRSSDPRERHGPQRREVEEQQHAHHLALEHAEHVGEVAPADGERPSASASGGMRRRRASLARKERDADQRARCRR